MINEKDGRSRVRRRQLAVFGIVLLTVLTRLPALLHPQPIDDEAVYSVVANEIVDGGRPYLDAVERKPPLLFWTYAAVFEAAGKYNWEALHLVALLWTLGTMAGLYVIGKQLFGFETGLIAALLYSIFQPWMSWKNLGLNGELLMNLPLVWAWAIGLRRTASRMRPELLVAGALLCAAFLLKQPAAIAAIPLGLYFLLPSYRAARGVRLSDSFLHLIMLIAGFFGSLTLVIIVLRRQGIFHDAYYWTVAAHTVPYVFWKTAAIHTLAFAGICWPIVLGAARAVQDRDRVWTGAAGERTALLLLVVASVVGVSAGGRFYPHYYIQLIPPLTLLAAPYYARFLSPRTQPRPWWTSRAAMTGWLAFTVVAFFIADWILLIPERASSEAGEFLLKNSAAGDRIFVWGHQAKIYLDARRRPACRYIITFPLTGYIFGDPLPGLDTKDRIMPGAWAALEEDFARHPPTYIVDIQSGRNLQYPIQNFPILARLLADRYLPVKGTSEGMIYRLR
jgi:4-amino-4-deoxy-L-arabinose transferase-like glycosyltransferase